MLDVRTDTQHKRIYLTFSGTNDVKAATEGASRLLAATINWFIRQLIDVA